MTVAAAAVCALLAALFVFIGIADTFTGSPAAWVLVGPPSVVLACCALSLLRQA